MVLIATDLPEPVVPAISRCGIRARSTTTGSPPMVLPRQSGSFDGRVVVFARGQQLAEIDFLAELVRQFDADGVAARHHGDAGRHRAHRARNVVGKADHARRLDAGRGLEFVEGDHRTGARIDDLALHAEIFQHAFERFGAFSSISSVLGLDLSLAFGAARMLSGGRTKPPLDLRGFGCVWARALRGAGASSSSSSS